MRSVQAGAAVTALSMIHNPFGDRYAPAQIGEGQYRAGDRSRAKAAENARIYANLPEDRVTRQQQRAWAVKEAKRRNRKIVADDRAAQIAAYRSSEGTKSLRALDAGREKFRAARRTSSRVGWSRERLAESGIHLNSYARQMVALQRSLTVAQSEKNGLAVDYFEDHVAAKSKAPRKSRAKAKSTETI